MSRLQWPKEDRYYETGVDRVAVYVGSKSEAWNGVTAINESPSGGEPTKIYADNVVYGIVMSPEENAVTIEAFAYPRLFSQCIGKVELVDGIFISQQSRVPFAISYRNLIKNDNMSGKDEYKITLFYKLFSGASEDSNSTKNDSPEQKTYSFSATAIAVPIDDDQSTSSIVLDSRKFDAAGLSNALELIEGYLYGTDNSNPVAPSPAQIIEIIGYAGMLVDSLGNAILDNAGNTIGSVVFAGR